MSSLFRRYFICALLMIALHAHAESALRVCMDPDNLPFSSSGGEGFDSFGADGSKIVRAVAEKRVGLSVVWGPVAGYYAAQQKVPLVISEVRPAVDPSGIPFSYAISIAVHQNDSSLAKELNAAIERNRAAIRKILSAYHVPLDEGFGTGL